MRSASQSCHDVVIVGARAAGAATAMLLARLGHDVVVVDQASFPSDTLSTHSIARSGVVQLRRWGLLDPVLDSGAPAIRQVTFHAGGDSVSRAIKHKAGVDLVVAPRRYVLDTIIAAPQNGPAPTCGWALP
jgi:2-polyprenyl-6-methoxyphenol hydroxylase-like FAD-dependent oxidoreductase